MPLSSVGPISFSEIQSEFGGTNPISLTEYYSSGSYTNGVTGIPSSGPISIMNNLLGKSKATTTILTYNSTVIHIDDIPYSTYNSMSTNVFYLKYPINNGGVSQFIVVACRKSPSRSKVTQSCFTMNGTTLTYENPGSYTYIANDDHDTLFMDGQGNGYLSKGNTNTFYDASGFARVSMSNGVLSFNTGVNQPQGYPGSGTFTTCTCVAFPQTARTLYFNRSSFVINGFSAQTWPAAVTTYIASDSYANNLTTVSDGVNSVLIIYGTSVTSAYYVTFNLSNGTLYSSTAVTLGSSFTWTNTTEEDAVGNQLFAIDGAISYYSNLAFYYTPSTIAGYSFLDQAVPSNSISVGLLNTQSGMDIITCVDQTDAYVYFTDWGHDNGGLFNFGDDNILGFTKTNILKLPASFNPISFPTYVNMAYFVNNIGSIYQVNGFVTHIDDIPYSAFSSAPSSRFYLRYNIMNGGSQQSIVVACRKSTNNSRITQSMFTITGSGTPSFDVANSYTYGINDDHDTLFMDGAGYGYLSKANTNNLYDANGFMQLTFNNGGMSVNTGVNNPQSYPGIGTFTVSTCVAFPLTSRTLYFNRNSYQLSGFSIQTWPAAITTYIATNNFANNLTTVSDGVNSVLIIYGSGVTSAYYVSFSLSTGTLYSSTNVTLSSAFTWYNTTEEDAIGNQLFAVDGGMSYYRNLNFHYTPASTSGYSFIDHAVPSASTTIGVLDTQTGMDIFAGIDSTDGFAYVADWGHNNGGLFNIGSDNTLAYAKTNICRLPNTFLGSYPSRTSQAIQINLLGNNIYHVGGILKHIDDIPYNTFSSITSNKFFLMYTIANASSFQRIIVSCRRSTNNSRITQSCFTLNGQALTFGTAKSYVGTPNDDHDTLYMDGQGNGFLSKTNSNAFYEANGLNLISFNNSVLNVNTGTNQPQGYPGSGTFTTCTIVAFPHTTRTLYFNRTNYMISGFTAQTWPAGINTYIATDTYANNLTTVSDGVNSVLIIYGSVSNGWYCTFDLTTGLLYTSTNVTFNSGFAWTNGTEEDAVGNQLFSVDGGMSYYSNLAFYYVQDATSGYSFIDQVVPPSSTAIGSVNTQTGMDLITCIDQTDGYVYFTDWGHDNGGLFNFGNDDTLGYTKTNIFKIPSNFAGTSPNRVSF